MSIALEELEASWKQNDAPNAPAKLPDPRRRSSGFQARWQRSITADFILTGLSSLALLAAALVNVTNGTGTGRLDLIGTIAAASLGSFAGGLAIYLTKQLARLRQLASHAARDLTTMTTALLAEASHLTCAVLPVQALVPAMVLLTWLAWYQLLEYGYLLPLTRNVLIINAGTSIAATLLRHIRLTARLAGDIAGAQACAADLSPGSMDNYSKAVKRARLIFLIAAAIIGTALLAGGLIAASLAGTA